MHNAAARRERWEGAVAHAAARADAGGRGAVESKAAQQARYRLQFPEQVAALLAPWSHSQQESHAPLRPHPPPRPPGGDAAGP